MSQPQSPPPVEEDDWADLLARMGDQPAPRSSPAGARVPASAGAGQSDATALQAPRKPFMHYCHCGEWGSFGYGYGGGKEGKWYCREHRPCS